MGFQWNGTGTVELGCNDWSANLIANTQGVAPGATDVDLDPEFCDIPADNVFLSTSSPLIDLPGCGLIGARPQGCATTVAVGPSRNDGQAGLIAYPQPGRGHLTFAWKQRADVAELEVFDILGARRWQARVPAGVQSLVWSGRDEEGLLLPAGVYFARLHGSTPEARVRIVLVR